MSLTLFWNVSDSVWLFTFWKCNKLCFEQSTCSLPRYSEVYWWTKRSSSFIAYVIGLWLWLLVLNHGELFPEKVFCAVLPAYGTSKCHVRNLLGKMICSKAAGLVVALNLSEQTGRGKLLYLCHAIQRNVDRGYWLVYWHNKIILKHNYSLPGSTKVKVINIPAFKNITSANVGLTEISDATEITMWVSEDYSTYPSPCSTCLFVYNHCSEFTSSLSTATIHCSSFIIRM